MGNYSDDKANLLLDEDVPLMTQDIQQGVSDVEIKDTTLHLLDSRIPQPKPSISSAELVNKPLSNHQPVFKWSHRAYTPNVFSDVKYEFGKVQASSADKIDV